MGDPVSQQLIHQQFLKNLRTQARWAALLIGVSLVVGVLGFHVFARLPWMDALLNTCMLLGGMGPVGPLPSTSAKLFAGFFSLYSGLVFLVVAGLLLTPVFHRELHRFHVDDREHRK